MKIDDNYFVNLQVALGTRPFRKLNGWVGRASGNIVVDLA